MKSIPNRCSASDTSTVFFILFWLPCLLSAQMNVTIAHNNVTCFGGADGLAIAYPTGGTLPYTYAWSNSGTTQNVSNLSPGNYSVTVSDANQQTKTASTSIIQPPPVGLDVIVNGPLCGHDNGSIVVYPIGGTQPYQFQWSNGETSYKIEHLAAGTYTVTVSDTPGCTNSKDFILLPLYPPLMQVLIPTPFCLNDLAVFIHHTTPFYPEIWWSLSDSLDQIVSGQGTDTIQVQWNATGSKHINVTTGINGVFCTQTIYYLSVAVCANTNEPALVAATVSPNPFSEFLKLEFLTGLPSEAEAVMTDVSGKIVLEKSLLSDVEMLPMGNIPGGIYFLKIKSADGERVWRLVKH